MSTFSAASTISPSHTSVVSPYTTQPHIAIASADFNAHKAFALRYYEGFCTMHAIKEFGAMPSLIGLDSQHALLEANTTSFLQDGQALHALLYGARGSGKSSLIKATILPHLLADTPLRVLVCEPKDIGLLPFIFDALREQPYKFIVLCDDLSFHAGEHAYKAIKSTLDGSLEANASNILLYTTTNIPKLIESKEHINVHTLQEELSLSDRFGLQIGFYDIGSSEYLAFVAHFLGAAVDLSSTQDKWGHLSLAQHALNFATKMGGRNARIAQQFAIMAHNALL